MAIGFRCDVTKLSASKSSEGKQSFVRLLPFADPHLHRRINNLQQDLVMGLESSMSTVAFIGNPNVGKTTIFGRLTGTQVRVGNFPGVTVEKKVATVDWDGQRIRLIDLPGTYSLSPRTVDEMVAVDVLLGRQPDVGAIDVVVCIVDAANLERNLYLVSQLLDVNVPIVLVMNMWDTAEDRGISTDLSALSGRLEVPVIKTKGHRGDGLNDLKQAILTRLTSGETPAAPRVFPQAFYDACEELRDKLLVAGVDETSPYLLERLILDAGGHAESRLSHGQDVTSTLTDIRRRLAEQQCPVPAIEARSRYAWVRQVLDGIVSRPPVSVKRFSDRVDEVLTHRVWGPLIFIGLMFVVFQSIYAWAGPAMDGIETGQFWVAEQIESVVQAGPLRSLLVDGIVAGVGSVVVFLPQIAILFCFIAILEDCGYMARAAFLMDRLMTRIGLSGKSFIPLMSSFACAIPGIMATRVIENRRDRMVTILIAPLMSCSARLPVYLLLIAAFVPATSYLGGWVGLHGLVLFAMTFLGAAVAIPVAWLLKTFVFPGETPPFVMELPAYQCPSVRVVTMRVVDRCKAFLYRAGSLIFATTVLIWAAGSFPGDHTELYAVQNQIESGDGREQLIVRRNELSANLLEQSLLGRVGKAIEPVVKPLGWDWRIGVGALASFPAREVIIATLGTIYRLGGDIDESDEGLQRSMQLSTWPDGTPVFDLAVALSVMVFFALCAQCGATLMVIKRETNSWRWPLAAFVYMTLLAYVGALVTYQITHALLT